MAPAKHERADVSIALKALSISTHLSSAAKSVGAALLDHVNRKTGQCDPSTVRLATLLGFTEKTVRRATESLCEIGMFDKRSHGGRSGRASYTPKWDVFRAAVEDWHNRMLTGAGPDFNDENRTEMSGNDTLDNRTKMSASDESADTRAPDIFVPTTGHSCLSQPDKNVLQTYNRNLSIEPINATTTLEQDAAREIQAPSLQQISQGLLRKRPAAPKPPGYEASEKAATQGCSRSDAAWMAAQRRLDAAIAIADQAWQSDMWVLTDVADRDRAITTELKRKGQGIACLQAAVRLARLRSEGAAMPTDVKTFQRKEKHHG